MTMTRPWTRCVGLALVLSLSAACGSTTTPATPAAQPSLQTADQDAPALIRNFVAHLPIGTNVKVTLNTGTSVSGILMEVQDTAAVIKRRTRVPEPARTLAFSVIVKVEPESTTGSTVKAAVLGAAAGAAAVIGVLLILVAHSG